MGHHNSNHQLDMHGSSLFLLTLAWVSGTNVSLGCCTSTYYFADGPHGPRNGSGSRPRLPGWYFRDKRRVYAVVLQTDLVDQSDIQGTF